MPCFVTKLVHPVVFGDSALVGASKIPKYWYIIVSIIFITFTTFINIITVIATNFIEFAVNFTNFVTFATIQHVLCQ